MTIQSQDLFCCQQKNHVLSTNMRTRIFLPPFIHCIRHPPAAQLNSSPLSCAVAPLSAAVSPDCHGQCQAATAPAARASCQPPASSVTRPHVTHRARVTRLARPGRRRRSRVPVRASTATRPAQLPASGGAPVKIAAKLCAKPLHKVVPRLAGRRCWARVRLSRPSLRLQ